MNAPMKTDSERHHRFVQNFAQHQSRVYSFVVALAPRWSDAEEIFQQTTLVLWQKWDEFDPERPFLPWACGVARLEALKYLSAKGRSWQSFTSDVMEQLAADAIDGEDALQVRADALQECLKKLPPPQRSLIESCYAAGHEIRDVAVSLGLTANAIYLKLRRIRQSLHECVDRKTLRGENA